MTKDNPKHIRAMKDGKVPMHLIPWGPLAAVARVLQHGAEKYGERNWLIDEIKCSTYEGAIGRHTFLEWARGVNRDADSGEHPLAHVIACCLIVMDAEQHGTLIDDRGRRESFDQDQAKPLPKDRSVLAAPLRQPEINEAVEAAIRRSGEEVDEYLARLNTDYAGPLSWQEKIVLEGDTCRSSLDDTTPEDWNNLSGKAL